MPKYLYVIEGTTVAQTVCDLNVCQYRIIRETEKRWYVHRWSEEIYILKSRPLVFTNFDDVVAELKAMKARQLVEASEIVELLKQETTISLIEVPFGGHLPQEGPIEL